jgi:lipopolysaccharide export system protein LptC
LPMPDSQAMGVARRDRTLLQRWATPGGRHDRNIWLARRGLPVLIAVLGMALLFAPLLLRGEVSFVLAKDSVAIAKERMKVISAVYRGEDSKGQPFTLSAGSAVQASSKDPVVRLKDLSAEINLADGPAKITAEAGRYDMDKETVSVDGPVRFTTSDGYALSTRDVSVGLKSRRIASGGPVSGQMPLGSFSAGSMKADLGARTVVLEGRARLHIVQGAVK